jgi:hypothetical protein
LSKNTPEREAQFASIAIHRSTHTRPMRRPPRAVSMPGGQTGEVKINDGGRVKREPLAQQQTANDRIAERPPKFGAGARAEHQREAAEESRHGGHHDRPEAKQTRLIDRVVW